jgi:hypothetical protein
LRVRGWVDLDLLLDAGAEPAEGGLVEGDPYFVAAGGLGGYEEDVCLGLVLGVDHVGEGGQGVASCGGVTVLTVGWILAIAGLAAGRMGEPAGA